MNAGEVRRWGRFIQKDHPAKGRALPIQGDHRQGPVEMPGQGRVYVIDEPIEVMDRVLFDFPPEFIRSVKAYRNLTILHTSLELLGAEECVYQELNWRNHGERQPNPL